MVDTFEFSNMEVDNITYFVPILIPYIEFPNYGDYTYGDSGDFINASRYGEVKKLSFDAPTGKFVKFNNISEKSVDVICSFENMYPEVSCKVDVVDRMYFDLKSSSNGTSKNGTQTITVSGLMPNTEYAANVIVSYDNKNFGSGLNNFKTSAPLCPDSNHPHAIDLGLPSGTKWCCMNVGASSPEGYGGYYAWGETSEKSVYNMDTYAYYNSSIGWVNIGSDIAGTSYDAAHVNMGGSWVMPSTTQQQELINNCSRECTQQNGVNGTLVTGPNGGKIFLPAAGSRWGGYLDVAGPYGDYWSSSLGPYDGLAYYLCFFSGSWSWYDDCRSNGQSVRAVCP